jgi:hypothetical protein
MQSLINSTLLGDGVLPSGGREVQARMNIVWEGELQERQQGRGLIPTGVWSMLQNVWMVEKWSLTVQTRVHDTGNASADGWSKMLTAGWMTAHA